MAASDIVVRGACEHNLQSVDLVLPRDQLICLTGVSGSGKSSLAFDTLYAEGQRRYVESLSSYARHFLGQMPKPQVDSITGLRPSISISQKTAGQNPRSTVGTITEIYDYLRVLYARTGQGNCSKCGRAITAQTREQIIARIEALPEGTPYSVLAPVIRQQKGEYRDLFEELLKQGYVRARVDGAFVRLSDSLQLDRQMRHNIDVVVDRLVAGPDGRARLAEAVEMALQLGEGNLVVAVDASKASPQSRPKRGQRKTPTPSDLNLSAHYACTHCGLSFQPPTPQMFSFNSPQGMCLTCDGLAEIFSFSPERLVTDPEQSLNQGAIRVVGSFKEMGRWRRHLYRGVAETMEHKLGLEPGSLLQTPWQELDPEHHRLWLWGTDDEHITFTWRHGSAVHKYGGQFEGIIPELISKHRGSKSKPQIAQLEKYMTVIACPDCSGQRLNPQARAVTLKSAHAGFRERPERSLPDVCGMPVSVAAEFFSQLDQDPTSARIASEVLKEIRNRLGFLVNVGLEYLTLDRTSPTLAGGEAQRIRLAGQIGSGLVGVLYILDEPSIGLHPRDNHRLLSTLKQLRDLGNTVVVVEHDEDTIRAADHIIDFGPGPGVRGGRVVGKGDVSELIRNKKSVTGRYLAGTETIDVPTRRRPVGKTCLKVVGAAHNNLKNIDVEIPLGALVCVTGVSGSGKSSLVNDILVEALRRDVSGGKGRPGKHKRIRGVKHLDKLIAIDQSPIGRTPRSNPATYTKVLDDIRALYAGLPDAKRRGYKPGRFSFNVRGGRCEACEGNGANRLEMDFLADVWVTCPVCEGHRFNHETLAVQFKGHNISHVLEMDVQQALVLFENIPAIQHKLQTLHDVGLDYLQLGQPSPTLSGGEAQRIKLARELIKKSTGRTLYVLDEPTTGLHFADVKMLLSVLQSFVDAGNTVLVVEHNVEVIKSADWIVDLGPEGGHQGGQIVACGTPEQVAGEPSSYTGQALAEKLPTGTATAAKPPAEPAPRKTARQAVKQITVQGARQHNLKGIDVSIPRDQITVCCGPSGSGKSSLAMDTVYAEGQRRYVESLSAYARQFVSQMQKPQVDHVEGLSPSIAIQQRNMGQTSRSTVGTVTEIYDYLRILFARLGQPYCPDCELQVGTQSADEIIDKIMAEPRGTRMQLLAPIEIQVGQSYATLWDEIRAQGYVRVRVDGLTHTLDDPPAIDRRRKHTLQIVVDRITVQLRAKSRIADSVENALALGKGVIEVTYPDRDLPEPKWKTKVFSQHLACDQCGRSFEPLSPHHFSFNSPLGWCDACDGLGTQTGTNPAALIPNPKLTLREGALGLWPAISARLSQSMLDALSQHSGLPTDVPYDQLSLKQQRILLYGTGDDWIEVAGKGRGKKATTAFRFQYKGLYPALDEASRLSTSLRAKLEHLVDDTQCSQCGGSRLRDDASAVRFRSQTIDQICRKPLRDLLGECGAWKLARNEKGVAAEPIRQVQNRLKFLVDVGLDYITLDRAARTLSGGESQRIRLASQVGSGLCGVLYVLDEPTIGLHPRDNHRLIDAMRKLCDLGNTLLVVEHDRQVVQSADRLLDFGPAAGRGGGEVVAAGTPQQVMRRKGSITGPYLSGKKAIPVPTNRRLVAREGKAPAKPRGQKRPTVHSPTVPQSPGPAWLEILGANHNNLRGVDARIPLGTLTVITGVSGSGKSSLIEDVLYRQLAKTLHRARTFPGQHEAILGLQQINKVIRVDQQPLGNSPTSNPATYTGVFELIRSLFAQLPESKLRGYSPRRFSFNVPGGRCEACEGNGQLAIEMHFLPDVWVECDICRGLRYNPETLNVRFHGRSIADVLNLPCGEAAKLFENIPKIRRILQTLCDVGVDYLTLGQPAPTLSGGEAQRVKLAAELSRPDTGRTLYLLDEPTTGLHFDDLDKLLGVIHRLVDLGNTVVVIEHNLDVIKSADWVIEVGPEAGDRGGKIVATGPPEEIVAYAQKALAAADQTTKRSNGKPSSLDRSHTGEALAEVLAAGPHRARKPHKVPADASPRKGDMEIADVGRTAKMPWQVDGKRWHTADRTGRNGNPCQWEGRILSQLEERIHDLGEFSPTDWNSRSVVEIAASRKSDGWFLHAITGETWLLKLKFRTSRGTFKRDQLVDQLALKPLNDLPDLPIYGHGPRVRSKNLRGPWQEVQLDVHRFDEIDTPEFWQFVERAVAGFKKLTERAREKPEDLMPWRVLGRKWHLSRKGFPPGKRVHWNTELLETLCDLLAAEAGPTGEFLWHNQQVVHLRLPGHHVPWASVYTKRPAGLDLVLTGPKGMVALGRFADLGAARVLKAERPDRDTLKLRFKTPADLKADALAVFLREHLAGVRAASKKSKRASKVS